MCGIAGYKVSRSIDRKVLNNMVSALFHRGPDSDGFFVSGDFNAGMRRLSINGLDSGDQPLYSEDKSIVLFYNGEIYNSPELRKSLSEKGYLFRTESDGEVICHLYKECGEELFEKLDGMFALALWVENEKKLILARDFPGEKPLYYAPLSDTEIIFSSEIKSLMQFSDIDKELNYQALWDFPTFLWIPEPDTVFKSVKCLPKGHILVVDAKGTTLKSYQNKFNSLAIKLDDNSVIEETRRVVSEAIESRLLSDVRVGCFLSSGLDSSIVTTVASKILPDIKTFTIAFENVDDPYHGKANEANYAENYAKKLGLEHETIYVTQDSFRKSLLDFCLYGDQPFSVSSGLGILSIAKAANESGIKVLLSGDGADECFGGYSWYDYLNIVDDSEDSNDEYEENVSFQNFGMGIHQRLSILKNYSSHQRAWAWHYYASEEEKGKLFHPDIVETKKDSYRFFKEFDSSEKWNAKKYIDQDRDFYFPFEMLRKVDRMTMAHSVEGRVPFAAPSVLAHAEKLKFSHMVRKKSLKWVLREAFSSILPESVYNRPKHGFNVPIDHWLKNDWFDMVEETFSENSVISKNKIVSKNSRDVVMKMLNDKQRLNGHTIFSFIMLNLWMEKNNGNYC